MKPRKNPTDTQLLRRQQKELISPSDPRVRNDAYWALRHQGYPHEYAKRAFRDCLPRYHKEQLVDVSNEYLEDIDPNELLFVPSMHTEMQKLSVLVRPELTDGSVATAAPRSIEYTIWDENPPGFGLRVRPSGSRSFISIFRIAGNSRQYKITLGKAGELPIGLARKLAREIRMEANAGYDPRPMHKRGDLLKRIK